MSIMNGKKVVMLIFLFVYIFASAQDPYIPCEVGIKYAVFDYPLLKESRKDSFHIEVFLCIPSREKDVDYKIEYGDIGIWDSGAEIQGMTIDEAVEFYISEGKSKVLIEFDDGTFMPLSFMDLHAVFYYTRYIIVHVSTEVSCEEVSIGSFSSMNFIWGDKFRLWFILKEFFECKTSPVVFRSSWIDFKATVY